MPQLPPFDAARCEDLRADKYSTIVIDSCHYSVPDAYVGKIIFTKIYSHKVLAITTIQKLPNMSEYTDLINGQ
ncbi:Mu transposase domain-containing protein [Thermoanaerobacterium thermosaccharolyticum]|uniref:Mu transposase domain-containing protein n=1 Tax=Thermoanaerobacterium thermosaccharolyticum TaxID=1517 RepID=UPI0018C8C457|nr:hypothetical protein [Thermoanaerobacterium thermosaccharolyticum]